MTHQPHIPLTSDDPQDRLTESELEAIRARCEKASEGPWLYAPQHHGKNQRIAIFEEIVPEYNPAKPLVTISATAWKPERHKSAKPNAEFIAHSRTDIPRLLADVTAYRAEVHRLKAALTSVKDMAHNHAKDFVPDQEWWATSNVDACHYHGKQEMASLFLTLVNEALNPQPQAGGTV